MGEPRLTAEHDLALQRLGHEAVAGAQLGLDHDQRAAGAQQRGRRRDPPRTGARRFVLDSIVVVPAAPSGRLRNAHTAPAVSARLMSAPPCMAPAAVHSSSRQSSLSCTACPVRRPGDPDAQQPGQRGRRRAASWCRRWRSCRASLTDDGPAREDPRMRVIAGRCGGRRLQAPPGGAPRGRPPTGCARRCSRSSATASRARGCSTCSPAPARWASRRSRAAPPRRRSWTRAGRDARARANLEALGVDAEVRRADALRVPRRRIGGGAQYDLVFLDPPYRLAGRLGRELAAALPAVLAPGARGGLRERPPRAARPRSPRHRRTPLRRHTDPHPWPLTPASPSAPAPTTRSPTGTSTSSPAPRRCSTS